MLSQEVRGAGTNIVILHQMFAGALRTDSPQLESTDSERRGFTSSSDPCCAQPSAVISPLLVLPFPASCDMKEA